MGLFNINAIGAFIVTILLLGILQKRPSLASLEDFIDETLPLYANIFLTIFLLLVLTTTATELFSTISIINLPSFLIEGLTLWIHEAGHIYWMWGGELMTHFGGTLNEIIFPLVPFFYCLWKGYYSLAGLFIYWLGLNCFGISKYIADAQKMELPLLGAGSHDWNNILKILDSLKWHQELAISVYSCGWLLAITGILILTNFGRKLLP